MSLGASQEQEAEEEEGEEVENTEVTEVAEGMREIIIKERVPNESIEIFMNKS